MELSSVLARVRKLVAAAEAPIADTATPEERAATLREQESARQMADALMLKYAIDEIGEDETRPATARSRPSVIEVQLTGYSEMMGYVQRLASLVAKHTRCQVRSYTSWNSEDSTWMAKVYGYESDLHYFEILYTTLRLHMIGALRPKVDPAKSLEDNAYALHNAGLNWTEIMTKYGWCEWGKDDKGTQQYRNRETGETLSYWTVAGRYKAAYNRAVKARGERPVKIPAGAGESFRLSAAQGYIGRLRNRLLEIERKRETGAELVLRGRESDLAAFFREMNPDLFEERKAPEQCEKCARSKSGYCREHPKGARGRTVSFSDAGYRQGVAHANTASLSPEAGASTTRAIS
jgi:hypothetical protein